jgi:hypothetical protein
MTLSRSAIGLAMRASRASPFYPRYGAVHAFEPTTTPLARLERNLVIGETSLGTCVNVVAWPRGRQFPGTAA